MMQVGDYVQLPSEGGYITALWDEHGQEVNAGEPTELAIAVVKTDDGQWLVVNLSAFSAQQQPVN